MLNVLLVAFELTVNEGLILEQNRPEGGTMSLNSGLTEYWRARAHACGFGACKIFPRLGRLGWRSKLELR